MTIYNVRVSVVELVEASTPEAALNAFVARLREAGFSSYEGDPGDAFESEPIE